MIAVIGIGIGAEHDFEPLTGTAMQVSQKGPLPAIAVIPTL